MNYFLRPNDNPPVSTLLQEVPTAIEQEMVDESVINRGDIYSFALIIPSGQKPLSLK